jgi:hypothetical protein
MKNGPEIVDFRPVLCVVVALANRRLQPLGHLTAALKYTAPSRDSANAYTRPS